MRTTSIRHLYGSSTASTNDLAHIDVIADSIITGVDWAISTTATAGTNDRVMAELTTSSVCQATTNDCGGIISNCDAANGSLVTAVNKFCGPTGVFVPRGTRLFLNTLQVGTTATSIKCNVHLSSV